MLAMRGLAAGHGRGNATTGARPVGRSRASVVNGWSYELSEWIEYTPAKKTFEGIGLAPDVFVRATAADAGVGRDAALERALTLAAAK